MSAAGRSNVRASCSARNPSPPSPSIGQTLTLEDAVLEALKATPVEDSREPVGRAADTPPA